MEKSGEIHKACYIIIMMLSIYAWNIQHIDAASISVYLFIIFLKIKSIKWLIMQDAVELEGVGLLFEDLKMSASVDPVYSDLFQPRGQE